MRQRDDRRIHRSRIRRSLFLPKTLQSYAQALRKIAGDITGETKREQRDAIKLRTLRPEKIEGIDRNPLTTVPRTQARAPWSLPGDT